LQRQLLAKARRETAASKHDVTIVLPTLNEEKGITLLIDELVSLGYHNILVVDGYSTDETALIAGGKGARVILQQGDGKTQAIKTAIENTTTPYLLIMDGDHTYNPGDIERFLTHARNYDYIIGSRINGRHNIPWIHRIGNRLLTKTFNTLMGTGLSDICSGMYLIRTKAAQRLELKTNGFSTEVEIAAQLATTSKTTQVPVNYRPRVGQAKLSTVKHGFEIMTSILNLARRHNPTLFYSLMASLTALPAFPILAWVAAQYILNGVWHSGWAVFGVVLLLFASQAVTLGAVSAVLRRIERRIVRHETEAHRPPENR